MGEPELQARIEAVRRFSRFYTKQIGVLRQGLLDSPFTLVEARIIYELAQRPQTTATELRQALGLDAGYLSRLLRRLEHKGLVARRRAAGDGRRQQLCLTGNGERAFAELNTRSRNQIRSLLGALSAREQTRLVGAMGDIEGLLGAAPELRRPYLLRPHQPGDMGWIVHRQAVLYAEEYGWDESFEALVARIAADFLDRFDAAAERCWIAEKDGAVVGSVFVVRKTKRAAQLRLLYVEPSARGLGLGTRLVEECIGFARRAGYHRLTLWTNSVLHAARRIYEHAGFRLVEEEPHHSFGVDLVGQNWELDLRRPRP